MPTRKDAEGRWHIEICSEGQRIHRILPKGTGKREAEAKEHELKQSLESRRYTHDPALIDVMNLYVEHADSLRSASTAKYHAARIVPYIEGKRASDAKDCADTITSKLRAKGYAIATINRSLGTLKKALGLAFDKHLTEINYGMYLRRMPEHNERDVFLSIDEVKKICDCASENVRAAMWIALLTGMRRGEVLKIKKEDIKGDIIIIPAGNTKAFKKRVVPITKAVIPWLEYVPFSINFEGLKTGFRRAREKAGMPHVHFHDLRHSCASLLIESDVPIEVVSKIMGHSSIKMTERYVHIRAERQREALEKTFGKLG
jgi:integrase